MENKNIYALLVGAGNYTEMNMINLPMYQTDLSLLAAALKSGLAVPLDHIRFMSGHCCSGFVSVRDLAKAIAMFKALLKKDDTFLFYFTGHGNSEALAFSDGVLNLQSLINQLNLLPCKNKIVIMDCCNSGKFTVPDAKQMTWESSVDRFAGHGIAVFASSSENEASRLGPDKKSSLFTGALSTAIALHKRAKGGKLSLIDIKDETISLINAWNRQNPEKAQHPVFRSSLGGTIYFEVEMPTAYHKSELKWDTPHYHVIRTEPLHAKSVKRYCVFVISEGEGSIYDLATYTKEIAGKVLYADIYANAAAEQQFKGKPARAVWCYFAHNQEEMTRHLFYAYTIWTADEEAKSLYCRQKKGTCFLNGIYIWENLSYKNLKQL